MKLLKNSLVIPLVLIIMTFIVYGVSYDGSQKHLNYFVPLADAFIHGRLHLTDNPSWLNELIEIQGKYYVVYPPMPAVVLIPLVLLFGTDFQQPILSIFIAAINVGLCYLVLNRVFHSRNLAVAVSVLYAFGSMQWYHAIMGSAWYIAHIIAMFFIWLALLSLSEKKRNYLVIGLLIGAAYWSRLPAVLAIVFPILFYWEDFVQFKPKIKIQVKQFFLLGLGVGIFVLLNALYNFVRFGVPYDISYQLLPIFEEPWYRHGLFNVVNIPIHLKEILFAIPSFSSNWPFIIPSLHVMALWFVTPAYLLLFFAPFRKRLVWSVGVTILIMSLPGLMHGSNGFTQFGFRFSLDYLPFLLILIAAGIGKRLWYLALFLICLSITVNLLGIISIIVYDKWTM